MNIDQRQSLAEGSVGRWMLKLAVPAIIAQIVNMLYNIVDRIYIGHIPVIGTDALTGVGLFAPVLMLLNAFAMLVGAGGAPRAAIAMGKGDEREANRILGNCFVLLLILAAALTVLFALFAPQLLYAFGASENTFSYALTYMRIYCLGSISVLLTMGLNPFVTTQGFAKYSMITVLVGAVANIILDPILIFGLDMGISGAAVATVISQTISAIWVLHFLNGKKTILRLRLRNFVLRPSVFLPCLALGASTFVMLSTESLVSVSFNTNLVKYGGDLAVGSMTIITSLNQLIVLPVQGICQGGQPLISYNYGAGRRERVAKSFRLQFFSCILYGFAFWILIQLFPGAIVRIFSGDADLIAYTVKALRLYMMLIFTFGFQCSCQQAFLALGKARVSLMLACLRKIVLLVPLIFLMPHLLPGDPVWSVFLAEPVSDMIAAIVTTVVFLLSFRKILREMKG